MKYQQSLSVQVDGGTPGISTALGRLVIPALLVWSCCISIAAVFRGSRHDYLAYLQQWQLVLTGIDPWSTNNTYGPLHAVLAFLKPLGPLAPKLFMVVAFLLANFLLAQKIFAHAVPLFALATYVVVIPVNFLVVGVVASYGLNDTLVAALIGFAILCRYSNRRIWTGIFIGSAILLKFYPALLLLFTAIDNRRFDWKIFSAAAAFSIIGLLVGVIAWGNGIIRALENGADRGPKLLSVLASWQFHSEFGGSSRLVNWLITWNAVFVIAAGLTVVGFAWACRLAWSETLAIGTFVVLSVYKVGHQQFFIVLMMTIVGLLANNTRRSHLLALCFVPISIFLSGYQFGHEVLTDGYNDYGFWVQANGGFFAFAIEVGTVASIIYVVSKSISGPIPRPFDYFQRALSRG